MLLLCKSTLVIQLLKAFWVHFLSKLIFWHFSGTPAAPRKPIFFESGTIKSAVPDYLAVEEKYDFYAVFEGFMGRFFIKVDFFTRQWSAGSASITENFQKWYHQMRRPRLHTSNLKVRFLCSLWRCFGSILDDHSFFYFSVVCRQRHDKWNFLKVVPKKSPSKTTYWGSK